LISTLTFRAPHCGLTSLEPDAYHSQIEAAHKSFG
jgi:hypothetical protein